LCSKRLYGEGDSWALKGWDRQEEGVLGEANVIPQQRACLCSFDRGLSLGLLVGTCGGARLVSKV
jgi:hypothetical protein